MAAPGGAHIPAVVNTAGCPSQWASQLLLSLSLKDQRTLAAYYACPLPAGAAGRTKSQLAAALLGAVVVISNSGRRRPGPPPLLGRQLGRRGGPSQAYVGP